MSSMTSALSYLKIWFLAIRPKTLTAAIVPVIVGSVLIYTSSYQVNWWLSVFALLGALFIQVGTNLVNDAIDFKKGADTQDRLGPTRVTQAGLISHERVFLAGLICFGVAMVFGLPLIMAGGWLILVIGLVSLICGYAYTAGPYPLAYKGLGELFVILFFGIVAVAGTFYLHSGAFSFGVLVAGLQIGALSTVLIAINNLRDHEGDRLANKLTLAVRFGKTFGRVEISALLLSPFLLNFYWIVHGYTVAAIFTYALIPLAFRIAKKVWTIEPSAEYNMLLAQSAKLHLGFGLLFSFGILLA
ncbi:MAG: 1,4-dihydroxy-2-naphthoate octaprenyltransferase [Proteobacteria bacterium SG_bin7]|nr:MAG: 1,4-dihydroxy-2-naphthoate octaprenyltransferase [Proteobacteria bacterium SG_bin7]